MPARTAFFGLFVAVFSLAASPARGQFEDLINKVPSTANTIFLLNADKILATPAATAGNWKAKAQEAYASGVTILPPDSSQAVLAAHFNLESMGVLWETAIMKLHEEPSLKLFAKTSKGAIGRMEDLNMVTLPGDAFVVQFAPKIVGALSPANRQTVARWIRQTKASTKPAISPYLLEAYGYANDLGTPLILALDLEDSIAPEHAREMILNSDVLTKAKVDIEKAVAFLTKVRGITLGVTIKDKPFGKIRVDFSEKISAPPQLAKSLLLEALGTHGAMLNELYDWEPEVDGKTFTLGGAFDQGGLRRVFSLFDRPPSVPKMSEEMAPAPTTQQRPDQAEIDATKAFVRHVTDMLDDLRREPRQNPGYSVGQIGVWYDNYARKIDRLPTMYVDPIASSFALKASNNLRAASQAIRSGAAQGRIGVTSLQPQFQTFTQNNVYGYGFNWWSGQMVPFGYQNTWQEEDVAAERRQRTQVRTQTRVTSMNQARDFVDQIQADLADTRRKLTEKFNVAF